MRAVVADTVRSIRSRSFGLVLSSVLVVLAVVEGLMVPAWMVAVMWVVNVGIAFAYRIIPSYLNKVSLHDEIEAGVFIGPSVTRQFQAFIVACGDHHEWSHVGMLLMMAGAMTGDHHDRSWLWGSVGFDQPLGLALMYGGFIVALWFDLRTLIVSYRAAEAFRKVKAL